MTAFLRFFVVGVVNNVVMEVIRQCSIRMVDDNFLRLIRVALYPVCFSLSIMKMITIPLPMFLLQLLKDCKEVVSVQFVQIY